jgi:hypothetical protein
MKILTTLAMGQHTIDFGVATTREEREAVLAQRFRVYQREGYYRLGVAEDQDEYDREAIFFLARLRRTDPVKSVMVGSARLIKGRADPAFKFPCQRGHQFELPGPVREVPAVEREEVGRVVSEMPRGWGVGQLVTTLGLLQAMGEHHVRGARQAPLRVGLATIKRRLLRGLRSLGLPLHEIVSEGVIYPPDGPVAGYFHRHPDPAVPVYWLVPEMIQAVRRVVARYRRRSTATRSSRIPIRSPGSWTHLARQKTRRWPNRRHRTSRRS